MPWCSHCRDDQPTERDESTGYICCGGCGKVLDQDIYFSGVTFEKSSNGQSRLSGAFVKSVMGDYSLSHERTLMKGRDEIGDIVGNLSIGGGDDIINQAHRFYQIAVERNFTRGRRTSQVAAACLYIACRQNEKPYLLIDFSDYLQINVYVLGAVFLQLCQLLRLEEHPIVQKPVDPSLFIHRFTECLLGERNQDVTNTALDIMRSMKRDWMQTGRKPSGLCGAALYISALSQGFKYSKSDIVSVVHVCEATLTKRLIEFENTESGSLTIEEFLTKADELKKESFSVQPLSLNAKTCVISELLCEHKESGALHFAHGLCRECYDEFIRVSGGLQGGSEPPAFQHAKRQRMEKDDTMPCEKQNGFRNDKKEDELSSKVSPSAIDTESCASEEPGSCGPSTGQGTPDESTCDRSWERKDVCNNVADEPESLSDIDDVEVDGYLHNEEEKQFKKIIWEKMNKEYLEEQAAKEAAAAAAKEAYDATFANCSEDVLSAQELAAAAAAAVAKSRKERKQKRAEEAKNSGPAQTAAEATCRMLRRKTFSSKINYEALNKLYTSEQEDEKNKQHAESDIGDDVDESHNDNKMGGKAFDSKVMDDHNDDYARDTFEDDYAGEYDDDYHYGKEDEYEFDFY